MKVVKSHVTRMRAKGHKVFRAEADGEPALQSKEVREALANDGIDLHKAAPGSRVPNIESVVGPARQQLLATLASFARKNGGVPAVCIDYLAEDATKVSMFTTRPKKGDNLTSGERYFGRQMMMAEVLKSPGDSVLCKRPLAGQTKDEGKIEHSILLCRKFDSSSTAIALNLDSMKVETLEINEMALVPTTPVAKAVIKRICDADKSANEELTYPMPLPAAYHLLQSDYRVVEVGER